MAYIDTDIDCKKLSIAPRASEKSCEECPVWAASGSFKALGPCVPNYCAREIWKKLSISAVGVNRKLRRLSSVGSTNPLVKSKKRPPAKGGPCVL